MELHTIELTKFSKNGREELADILTKVKNSLDMWAAFLTRHDLLNKDHLPQAIDNPILKKALGVLDVMSFGDEEREAYEGHLKWLRIEASTLKKYEAKTVLETLLLVATRMARQGASIEDIALITDLSQEQIKKLLLPK